MRKANNTRGLLCAAVLHLIGFTVPGRAAEAFDPKAFMLSELVENLDDGNHFKLPPKAQTFIREVLASGVNFTFTTHNKRGIKAYISSDPRPKIWINLAHPPERLGESICHEMLHYQDMQRFKPVTAIKREGLETDQTKPFYPVIGDLVNMISHEYVKRELEGFGYQNPMADNVDARMKRMNGTLSGVENSFVSISKQLAKTPNKKNTLGMVHLQALYQDLLLMTLRDKLLFDGAYTRELDTYYLRFQTILDFMGESTSEDPRFKRVSVDIQKPAQAIRLVYENFQAGDGRTRERYGLLSDTLGEIYGHLGISFEWRWKAAAAPTLQATSTSWKPGESFLLDGDIVFSKVPLFTPYSTGK